MAKSEIKKEERRLRKRKRNERIKAKKDALLEAELSKYNPLIKEIARELDDQHLRGKL